MMKRHLDIKKIMKRKELLLCPFCGGRRLEMYYNSYYRVVCLNKRCGTRGPMRSTEAAAIKAWCKQTIRYRKDGCEGRIIK